MRHEIHDNSWSRLGISVGFVSPFAVEGIAIRKGLLIAKRVVSYWNLKVTHFELVSAVINQNSKFATTDSIFRGGSSFGYNPSQDNLWRLLSVRRFSELYLGLVWLCFCSLHKLQCKYCV